MTNKLIYKRMFETRNMWPYYSIPHLGMGGKPFKELVGFEYARPINVVTAELFNEGWLELNELDASAQHFKTFWDDEVRVQKLLEHVRDTLKEAKAAEEYAWAQNWKESSQEELIKAMNLFYGLVFKTMTDFIISQPQHVQPLDQKINLLLEGNPDKDQIISAATYVSEKMPWAEEHKALEELHSKWSELSEEEKNKQLDMLVKKYGWINAVEGEMSFDRFHYRKQVEEYKPEGKIDLSKVNVPDEVGKIGKLLGELGFLRFWGRHYFMSMRYHLKNVLDVLISKANNDDLKFATVEELNEFFKGNEIDWNEIKARKNGHVTYIEDGIAKIATGEKAEELKKLLTEDVVTVKEVKGNIANKGKVTGRVRIISFTAKDYNEQVAAFEQGEILVTGMTRPQIVHLCKKAAAIVTDEGGITSHAAVVSREFGIPCVIATHNATRVFKTGDMVEVDADNGIVKVLI